jgi:hypothetical protein
VFEILFKNAVIPLKIKNSTESREVKSESRVEELRVERKENVLS